jgi:outer membrane lipoprotein-sorting protein
MRRAPTSLTIALMLMTPGVTGAADDIKNVDEVIAKYIDAIGGRKKIDAVKTMRATGKTTMGGGMEVSLSMEQKRPHSMRMESTLQGMTQVVAFDGETGWMVNPFMGKSEPEKIPDEMVKLFADQADIDGPLVDYQKKGHRVELLGTEDLDGSAAYKLKITKKDGEIEFHFLDAEHFLPLQQSGEREFQGSPMAYTVTFGDYKSVDGMMVAHSVTQQAAAMPGTTMVFEKIEINIDIPEDRFKMPAASAKSDSKKESNEDDE